jgi:hypothetical protein
MKAYETRPIRFVEILSHDNWKIKVYSISYKSEFASAAYIENGKRNLSSWLKKIELTDYQSHNIATLIIHECKEGCFAILNWWIDDNMLQHYVYLANNINSEFLEFSSKNGISTCVWELSILWFERNAWIQHVLREEPDFIAYLNTHLTQD